MGLASLQPRAAASFRASPAVGWQMDARCRGSRPLDAILAVLIFSRLWHRPASKEEGGGRLAPAPIPSPLHVSMTPSPAALSLLPSARCLTLLLSSLAASAGRCHAQPICPPVAMPSAQSSPRQRRGGAGSLGAFSMASASAAWVLAVVPHSSRVLR